MLEYGKWTKVTAEVVARDLKDHHFYLAVVEGYGTPMKVQFHDDSIPDFTWFCNNKTGAAIKYSACGDDRRIYYIQPLPEFPEGYDWNSPEEPGWSL